MVSALVSNLGQIHRKPKLASILALYIFGLLAVFLLPAPIRVTPEKIARFEKKLQEV